VQGGVQVNRLLTAFEGRHVVTLGTEAIVDDIDDRIEAYDFVVDQTTQSAGVFCAIGLAVPPQVDLADWRTRRCAQLGGRSSGIAPFIADV